MNLLAWSLHIFVLIKREINPRSFPKTNALFSFLVIRDQMHSIAMWPSTWLGPKSYRCALHYVKVTGCYIGADIELVPEKHKPCMWIVPEIIPNYYYLLSHKKSFKYKIFQLISIVISIFPAANDRLYLLGGLFLPTRKHYICTHIQI